ncbi:DNA/RNA non-specific endonuclease [Bacteroides helcogenes]|uniref:Endonuclease n=1 Tax=Bacteroides helcogenes (strain ATCC 35417 / DSM 20613 / JCM 6297 / CCUG 15421 / P 36-108) TaxID=693979 RepID=E6SNE0_BACT6|nr:DNA/RNA non-specific endonuclease [Bacteroides helcogenes]ADV42733.1 DNA/RNA non-specific endonuclease [Bacteroides helcogenes P 36-108]MDY5239564.1 DNA/RNA non-specific endonuclease [Bacteroides helcogenes]
MTKRRKKQSFKGVICLIALICIACLSYEPIAKALHIKAPVTAKGVTEEYPPEWASLKGHSPKSILLPAPLKNVSEQILYRESYTASYNKDLKLPNWVAWMLTPEKLVERESRSDKFLPDPELPENEAVTTDDYKGAGMDRGHMCPAGDSRWHWKAMQESFYMTNICPQDHNLNRGDWKELEESCRYWAQKEGRIYIVCGPILYDRKHRTIGRHHKITVPEAFFKVILCITSNPPKAIGFIYKNTSGNHPLDSYVNSVDEVERITGIDFFPTLPDNIEKKIEATYDLNLWK